jgi:HAD superfamily hydrolase (TIGR01509 family)
LFFSLLRAFAPLREKSLLFMATVLWDLDGTIADTEGLHFQAWQLVLDDYHLEYDEQSFLAGFGRSNRAIISELLGVTQDAPLVDEIAAAKEATFRSLLPGAEVPLLPGVAAWLAAFRAAGRTQVISSSGPMANIAAVVAKLDIADYFITLMSGATLPQGKPHPAIFLQSAAAAATPPAACLVIEDSIHGIAAARRAAMPSIAVGKLATHPDLAAMLAQTPGPECLPLPTLGCLDWRAVARLEGNNHLPPAHL